jgi:hypothetical protein
LAFELRSDRVSLAIPYACSRSRSSLHVDNQAGSPRCHESCDRENICKRSYSGGQKWDGGRGKPPVLGLILVPLPGSQVVCFPWMHVLLAALRRSTVGRYDVGGWNVQLRVHAQRVRHVVLSMLPLRRLSRDRAACLAHLMVGIIPGRHHTTFQARITTARRQI